LDAELSAIPGSAAGSAAAPDSSAAATSSARRPWLGYDTAHTAIASPEWTLLDASLPRRAAPMAAA
jgi:hypothetical protein